MGDHRRRDRRASFRGSLGCGGAPLRPVPEEAGSATEQQLPEGSHRAHARQRRGCLRGALGRFHRGPGVPHPPGGRWAWLVLLGGGVPEPKSCVVFRRTQISLQVG